MSKAILLAAAAVVSVSTVAAVYYTTPTGITASETPGILVDAPPADVVKKIRAISLENYLIHAGADSERARLEAEFYMQLSEPRMVSDTETLFDVMRGDDHLMQFKIVVKPIKGGKSEVDVQTLAGESRFSANPALHPYDVQLLLSAADFMATDYISSILKGHPMLMGQRLEKEFEKRYAFEADSAQASMKRIKNIFVATYIEDLKAESDGFAMSVMESEMGDGDEGDDESEPASDAAGAAGAAADAAAQAAQAASAGAEEDYW